jgi:hypothetical protein
MHGSWEPNFLSDGFSAAPLTSGLECLITKSIGLAPTPMVLTLSERMPILYYAIQSECPYCMQHCPGEKSPPRPTVWSCSPYSMVFHLSPYSMVLLPLAPLLLHPFQPATPALHSLAILLLTHFACLHRSITADHIAETLVTLQKLYSAAGSEQFWPAIASQDQRMSSSASITCELTCTTMRLTPDV